MRFFPDKLPARLRWILGGVLVAVLLGGSGAAWAARGDVPGGTRVLGMDLGGMSRAEATARLTAHAATLTTPVTVQAEGRSAVLQPAAIGLRLDVPATVAAAERGGPALFSGRDVAPVIAVDERKLAAALAGSALGTVVTAARKPAVTFTGTTPKVTYPVAGRGFAPQRSAAAVRAGWPGTAPIAIPVVEIAPAMTRAEVDTLVSTVARPAVAAPVTLTAPRATLTVPPAVIAASLRFTADQAGVLRPRVDPARLRKALTKPLAGVERPARDATITIAAGKPRITPEVTGERLDLKAAAPELLAVLPASTGRTVTAPVVAAPAATTAATLRTLGITERVSTFTTKFTGGPASARSRNIVTIAKEVRGAVVKPGATFSLNKHTGERGYAQGYRDAPVILDGKLVPGVGGGASQFTTTLFNATYYAGLEDVEHKPHSYYFDRYPAVIESTIFYPDLDFRFRNNTAHGVLLDTSWTSNSVTVSVWSTKTWDKVTTDWSARRNITTPRTIELPAGPGCIATSGINGFTQDAWRLFHRDGAVAKREKFTWRYLAEPNYLCAKD